MRTQDCMPCWPRLPAGPIRHLLCRRRSAPAQQPRVPLPISASCLSRLLLKTSGASTVERRCHPTVKVSTLKGFLQVLRLPEARLLHRRLATGPEIDRVAECSAAGCLSVLRASAVLDDAFRDFAHRLAQIHRGLLNPAESLGLGEPQTALQQPLGAVHRLAGLKAFGEVADLRLDRLNLGEPCSRNLDRRNEI